MYKRLPPLTLIALAVMTLMSDATALGYGRAPQNVALGQPLDFIIPLRLDASETLPSECVSAVVMTGDKQMPPATVKATVESLSQDGQPSVLRIRTHAIIDEPVVNIQVSAGCQTKVTRHFVAFADPPAGSPAEAPAQMAASSEEVRSVELPASAPGKPAKKTRATRLAVVSAEVSGDAAPKEPTKASKRAKQKADSEKVTVAAAKPKAEKFESAPARRKGDAPAAETKMAAAATPKSKKAAADKPAAAGQSHLRLDSFASVAMRALGPASEDKAFDKAEATATAAKLAFAESAASSSAARVAALERDLAKTKADAQAARAQANAQATKSSEAEGGSQVTLILGSLVAFLLGIAGWLTWQLKRAKAERDLAWWNAQGGAQDEPQLAEEGDANSPTADGWAAAPIHGDAVQPDDAHARAEPRGAFAAVSGPGATATVVEEEPGDLHPVTMDNLIDLDQQVDFFAVLGQDDSAVDMLVSHMRATGGKVPLAHLKLLEVYKRRNDRVAFDRARARFTHQFEREAPLWEDDLLAGKGLQDFPEALRRVQGVWGDTAQCMAVLEGMMFAPAAGPMLTLGAYRDALLLYSVQRDALDHDVQLPALDEDPFAPTHALTAVEPGAGVVIDLETPTVMGSFEADTAAKNVEPLDFNAQPDEDMDFEHIFAVKDPAHEQRASQSGMEVSLELPPAELTLVPQGGTSVDLDLSDKPKPKPVPSSFGELRLELPAHQVGNG